MCGIKTKEGNLSAELIGEACWLLKHCFVYGCECVAAWLKLCVSVGVYKWYQCVYGWVVK